MKRLILVFFLFSSLMAKSQCDTMTSATFTAITTNSVNVSFTVGGSNWTSFNVSLYDSATGFVAFNIPTLTTFTFAATGLTSGRTYVLRTFTNVPFGGGCEPNGTLPKFRTLPNIGYTPMAANGYLFKRISVDSTFHVPLQDTGLYKGLLRAGALVCRPQDSSFWGWNGRNWALLGGSSTGLIPLINSKVDSVVYAGDTLYYYKNGVGYGTVTNLALKENLSNKVNSITSPNSTDYPTTQALSNFVYSLTNGKLSVYDTASMLLPYQNAINAKPTYGDVRSIVSDSIQASKPTFLGTLYNKNTWANLTDFQNTTTASVSGGKILLSGGANNLIQTLSYNYFTFLERWKQTAKIRITSAASGSTNGIGLGIRSRGNVFQFTNAVQFDATNGANAGKLILLLNGVQVAVSNTSLSFSLNDFIVLSIERNLDYYTCKVTNATTNSAPVTLVYSAIMANTSSGLLHNTGNFAVFNIGGTFTLDSLSIYSNESVNSNLLLIGDSKTQGYNVAAFNNRFSTQLSYVYAPVVSSGGAGDGCTDVLNRVSEILALKPKQVLMCGIGRNDLANGVSLATVQANYQSIVTQLQAAGITVYHTNGFFETTYNQTAFSAWITATYGSSVIDTYSPTKNTPNTVASDGTHLTSLGDSVVFNTIVDYGLIKYGNSINSDIIKNTQSSGLTNGTVTAIPIYNSNSTFTPSNFNASGDSLFFKHQYWLPSTVSTFDNSYFISRNSGRSSGLSLIPNTNTNTGQTGFLTLYNSNPLTTSNWGRLIAWQTPSTNLWQIATSGNGTGIVRDLQLTTGSNNGVIIRATGVTEIDNALFNRTASNPVSFQVGTFAAGIGGASFGADLGTNTLTTNTRKFFAATMPNFTSNSIAGTQIAIWNVDAETASKTAVNIGGITGGAFFSPTEANFNLSTAVNTTTSTRVASVRPTGVIIQPAGGTYTVSTVSAFDVNSTTQGSRPFPQMTRTQWNAITKVGALFGYDNALAKVLYFDGTNTKVMLDSTAADARFQFKTSSVIGGSVSATVTAITTFIPTIPTQANNTYQVVITPSNALTAVNYYVTNKTTTSFDVVFTNPLTGTVAFDWVLKP